MVIPSGSIGKSNSLFKNIEEYRKVNRDFHVSLLASYEHPPTCLPSSHSRDLFPPESPKLLPRGLVPPSPCRARHQSCRLCHRRHRFLSVPSLPSRPISLLPTKASRRWPSPVPWWAAEIQRLRGVLLLRQPGTPQAEAEAWLQRALDVARRQEAKSLELRAAMSLGRLWQQQGKRTEAYDLLAPVYGWFTEGFDTADLQEARALLEELA
jgi:hypothetical protein